MADGRGRALAAGVVIALLAGEAVCRLLGLGDPAVNELEEERRHGDPIAYEPGSTLRYVYPDDPRGYFDADHAVVGSINRLGFRGPDVRIRKPPGRRRIAFLGDSFTLGIGVRDEDTLPAQFARALGDPPPAQVLNFGVSGSDTPEQMAILAQRVLAFAPDVIVTVVFLNDAAEQGTIRFLGQPGHLVAARQHSFLLNAWVGAIERRGRHRQLIDLYRDAYRDEAPGWQSMQQALARGHAIAAARGIRFVVAIYPILFRLDAGYPFAPAHEAIARFCDEGGIPVVDLFPAFEGEVDRDLWVHRLDQHPNERAHGLAAEVLADAFRKGRWVAPTPRRREAPPPEPVRAPLE